MKTFFLALFSVLALLGLVAPSFASEVTNLGRETNGERLARGLPPNPPSRRTTAKRHRPSQAPPPAQREYIEVRDLHGDVLGFVSGGGSHGLSVGWRLNFPVIFDGGSHTLSVSNGAQFLGGHDTHGGTLGSGHSTSVFLQKVSGNDHNSQDHIWTLNGGGLLTATWTNPGGSRTPAYFVLQGNSIKLTGDTAATGGVPVKLVLVHF